VSTTETVKDVSTSLDMTQNQVEMTQRLFGSLIAYHDIASRSAALNMAIDEALLETAEIPTIRFYKWNHPALSFGYFGRYADAADETRDMVRRWTGGGIVLHGNDLTYAIVIPAANAAFSESSISIYEKVHRALRATLTVNGQDVKLAPVAALCERPTQGESAVGSTSLTTGSDRGYSKNLCFANPVRADVMLNGHKIAGAAQRRTRCGVLQQGSIQGIELTEKLADQFARKLSAKCYHKTLVPDLIARSREIARHKYGTEAWLRKR
jgi:lipoate-protein ligase A